MLGFVGRVIPTYNMLTIIGMFFTYSVLGWIIESTYMTLCNKKLTNRGFIKGPICPIYGMGEFLVYTILAPFAGSYVILFIMGSLMASTMEYLVARLMIKRFGYVWWDYSNKPYNYKGILCLESSLAWGLYTIIEFAFLRSIVQSTVLSIPQMLLVFIVLILILYYTVSFARTIRKVYSGEIEDEENNLLRML